MDNSGEVLHDEIPNTNEQNYGNDIMPSHKSLEYLSMLEKVKEGRIPWSDYSDYSETTQVSSDVSQSNEECLNNSITALNEVQECLENISSTPVGNFQPIESNEQQNKRAHLLISNTSNFNANICDVNEDLADDSYCHTRTTGVQCSLKILNSKDFQTCGTQYDPPNLSSKDTQCSLENHITSVTEPILPGRTRCSACLEKCHISSRHGVCSVSLCKFVKVQSKGEDNNNKELVSTCELNSILQKESTCSIENVIENKENECGSNTSFDKRKNSCEDIFSSTPAKTCSTRSESTPHEDGLNAKITLKEKPTLITTYISDSESVTCTINKNCLEGSSYNNVRTTGVQCSINISDSENYQTSGTQYDPPNQVSQGTQWSYRNCISDTNVTNTRLRTILKCSECLKVCNTSSRHGGCRIISPQSTELLSKKHETVTETAVTTKTGWNAHEENISVQPYISSTSVDNTCSSNFNENMTDVSYNHLRTTGVQCSLTTLGSKNSQAYDTENDLHHRLSKGTQYSLATCSMNLPEQIKSVKSCCSDCRRKCNMSFSHVKHNVISTKPITPSPKRLCVRNISDTNTLQVTASKFTDSRKKCQVLSCQEMCNIISPQPIEHSIYGTKSYAPNKVSKYTQCSVDYHIRNKPADRLSERIPVCFNCIKKCNIGSGSVVHNTSSLSPQASMCGTKSDPSYFQSQGIRCSFDNRIQDNSARRDKIPVCSDCINRCNKSSQHGTCSVIYSQSIDISSKQKKTCEKRVVSTNNSMTKLGKDLPHCSKRDISNEVLSSMKNNKTLSTLHKKKSSNPSSSTSVCAETNISRSKGIQFKEVAMDHSNKTVNLDNGCKCSSQCTMQCIKQTIVQHQAKNNHFEGCFRNDSEDNNGISDVDTVLVNVHDNNVRNRAVQCTLKTLYSENCQSYGTQYDPPNIKSRGIQCSLEDLNEDICGRTEQGRIPVCSNCIRRCNIEASGLGVCNVISSLSADFSSKNIDKGSIPRRNTLMERNDVSSYGCHSRVAEQNLLRPEISQIIEDGSNNLPNRDSSSLKVLSTRNNNDESEMISRLNPIVVLHDVLKNSSEDPFVNSYLSQHVNIQGGRSVEERNKTSSDTNTGAETKISRSKSHQNKKSNIISCKSPKKKKRLWNPSNEIVSVSDGNLSELDGPATKQSKGRQSFRKLNVCN